MTGFGCMKLLRDLKLKLQPTGVKLLLLLPTGLTLVTGVVAPVLNRHLILGMIFLENFQQRTHGKPGQMLD